MTFESAAFGIIRSTAPSDASVTSSNFQSAQLCLDEIYVDELNLKSLANWSQAQRVVVHGVDDFVADGDQPYQIATAPAVSSDPHYSGRDAKNVDVLNKDDDDAGIIVTPVAGLVTTEAGGTATFTVRLRSQPDADVVIGAASDNPAEGTAAPASLTFTSGNWNTAP